MPLRGRELSGQRPRLSLREIRAALAAVPGVRDAVVVLREDIPGDRQLVAYLVASQGSAPDAGETLFGFRNKSS